jgi:hypothetical protein
VVLVHTQKVGIKYKKPLWFVRPLVSLNAGVGGRSIPSDRSPADRSHFHSGIFFFTDVSGVRNPIVFWPLTASRTKRLLHPILTGRRKEMSGKPRRLQ